MYFIKRELKECNPWVVESEYNYLIFGVFLAQNNEKLNRNNPRELTAKYGNIPRE